MAARKRKTPERWREFFIEIVTIVLGILIALGLDQAVENLRERGDAREARAAIDAEMQETELDRQVHIPDVARFRPPRPAAGAVAARARE